MVALSAYLWCLGDDCELKSLMAKSEIDERGRLHMAMLLRRAHTLCSFSTFASRYVYTMQLFESISNSAGILSPGTTPLSPLKIFILGFSHLAETLAGCIMVRLFFNLHIRRF